MKEHLKYHQYHKKKEQFLNAEKGKIILFERLINKTMKILQTFYPQR